MSGLTLNCIQSAENEFLAEQTMINIVALADLPQYNFISGQYGPYNSTLPGAAPLWLAITLYKRAMCKILVPEWMTVESLEARVAEERTQRMLSDLPYHYIEIAQILLNNARAEVQSPDRVSVLLQDIENIRMDRIRLGVMNVAQTVKDTDDSVVYAALNNVSSMEIFTMKRFFLSSMNAFYWLKPPRNAPPTSTAAGYGFGQGAAAGEGATGSAAGTGRTLRRFRK